MNRMRCGMRTGWWLTLLAGVVLAAAGQAEYLAPEPEGPLVGRRIVALVANGFHPGETPQPIAYWEALGAEVIIAGIEPGTVSAAFGPLKLDITVAVKDLDVDTLDAVFIPGGRSPAVLRENEEVLDFVRRMDAQGRIVTAICHGPQVLISAGILEGRRATCVVVEARDYYDVRDALIEAGGLYVNEPVVIDGTIITSRLPDDVPVFKAAVAEALRSVDR